MHATDMDAFLLQHGWMLDLLPHDLQAIVREDPTSLDHCLAEAERRVTYLLVAHLSTKNNRQHHRTTTDG